MGAKQSTKAEIKFGQYVSRLRRNAFIENLNLKLESLHEAIMELELEMNALDGEKGSKLPEETRVYLKEQYRVLIQECRDIVQCYRWIPELEKMKAPIYKRDVALFETRIITARQELEKLQSNQSINNYNYSHKRDLISIFERELQRLDKEYTDQFLNIEVRDSIDLIEKTLKEPHLYSLPHLIMWRDTAQEKIQKIQNFILPIPHKLAQILIQKYESLYKQLRAEILKLRTYPIPEPWRSDCMRQGVTHLIKGEFIFFVHPGIEEDMRPLILCERDILPGGLTRQIYNSRMDRLKRESAIAIQKLETKHARDIKWKLKWFEVLFAKIEKVVNFAFEELPLLHRDGRSLEYLVNKNQDDALLKEIYDILLRRIRHFYNNRIIIPSVAINYNNYPLLVAPPKAERNIPIASGVDRGATEGLQLVTPASVLVINQTVFVADKCGHLATCYRDSDLAALAWTHLETADTPVSLTVLGDSLFVCYTNEFVKYSMSWDDEIHVERIQFEACIEIPEICCTATYPNYWIFDNPGLVVGTLKPSLIHLNTDTLQIKQEYPLKPTSYSNKKNRHPWLQDLKTTRYSVICLFTGSPSPLQEFSLTGVLIRSILTEDKIVGAYHFNLFKNPVTEEWFIYITDFWDSAIKVFDLEGEFIETFSEKGFELGQIFHPTGISVEESGLITICDMKEENCLQRL